MPLPPGTPLGPYEVRELLGKGGMGEVYRARDRRLDRDVALKVISDAIAHDSSARTRFEREAKAIAALTHPNILSIFDFSKDHDHWYAVTELLQGETLRERLDRGKLTIAETIEIVSAVASGLIAAHDRAIIHRDLKPENVFLTRDGAVKILDFGLAQVKKTSTDQDKTDVLTTKAGEVVGTVTCMAPEQLRSEETGPATDIFALGCMLYEMVSGQRPFCGDNVVAVIAAVLKDAPSPLPDDVPADLAAVIMKCLQKEQRDRFQSAKEFREALEGRLKPAAPRPSQGTRVIVLPFRMLRKDDDLEFLASALPDAIVGSLAGLASLVVRSSLTASQYAGTNVDLARVAKEQDVNAIVSGTILASGGRLRVAAQLTEMPSATVKWSHSTETTLDDIFGVQDELTRKIMRSLAGPMTDSDSRALRKDAPKSALAYEFFLRASQQPHTPAGWLMARDLYRQSVEEDPEFAPAWARLGRCYFLITKYTEEPGDNRKAMDDAITRALELSPDLPLANRVRAEVDLDFGHSIDALKRLIPRVRQRPNDAELHNALGKALRYCGLLPESIVEFEKALEIDPKLLTSIGQSYFMLGDYPKTLTYAVRDIGYLGPLTLGMLGRTEEAVEEVRKLMGQVTHLQLKAFADGLIATLEGDRDEALRFLAIIGGRYTDPEAVFYAARQNAFLRETDKALALLERTVHGYFQVYALEHDPWLDSIRDTPRFAPILEQAKKSQAAARAIWNGQ